eukprot:778239-Alexandrium_andersonii.AAC.1
MALKARGAKAASSPPAPPLSSADRPAVLAGSAGRQHRRAWRAGPLVPEFAQVKVIPVPAEHAAA